MIDKPFIFIAGHHRSGTSLLHEIIREHPLISGFCNTGVPQDEGQHLQCVFEPAKTFGGAGRYIFNENSYMNEKHPLANSQSADKIMQCWERFYDAECPYYIEKSPPTLIRTRYFQHIFPNSKFIVLFRHPIAVAYATRKWSRTSIRSLIEHTLKGYEIFLRDKQYLRNVYTLRYEDFVKSPQTQLDAIFEYLGLDSVTIRKEIKQNINDKYFQMWEKEKKSFFKRIGLPKIDDKLESRANVFGYGFRGPDYMIDGAWEPNGMTNHCSGRT